MATDGQDMKDTVRPRWFSFWTGWFGSEKPKSPQADDVFLSIRAKDERQEINISEGNKRYSRAPAEYDHPMWRLGWTDGRSGQAPDVNVSLLEAQAEIEWHRKIEDAERDVADATNALHELQQERQRLADQQVEVEKQLDDAEAERREHYGDFSKKQGWMYLIFGAVVLAADIPLSLRLVAAGFGVKTMVIVDGKELRVENIFSKDFFPVVSHLWEAIILALGIAFTSILVKYFFDTVVFRGRAEKTETSATQIIGNPTAKKSDTTTTIIRVSRAALILFALTTICLGIFRYEMQPQVDKFDRDTKQATSRQQEIDKEYSGLLEIYQDEQNPAQRARDEATKIVDARPKPPPPPDFYSGWGLPTFILLTLLFPVVSGISFSVGGKKFRNAFLYQSLGERREALSKKIAELAPSISEKSGELAAGQAALTAGLSPEARASLLLRLRYLYLHGYDRGAKNVPHTAETQEGSVYQLSYKYFQNLLAEGLRNKK
jgi:hypothetical protein